MNARASALWVRLKANRPAYTLTILATLALGILIGTVVSYSVKGQEAKKVSGVIVDPKGFILTNRHVVEKADRIRVKLQDDPGSVLHDAKVVGTDQETDLAVIKIDVDKSLPSAKLGNSDSMQVGDWVLAVGSPFGLQETVTAGIVSAKG